MESCPEVLHRVLAALIRLSILVRLCLLSLALASAVAAQLLQVDPAVEHRGVDGDGPQEAQVAHGRRVARWRQRLRALGAHVMVPLRAEKRFGTQRALHDLIHFGVHLHATLFGEGPLEGRGHAGADLGYDGLAELQVVEALRGDEAAISLYPAAVLNRRSADAVGWKRGEEPLHPGAMKAVQRLPAGGFSRPLAALIG